MATLTVRKTGGQYSQIMAAIYAASNGDIIDIGPGTWNENIEFIGKSLTLQGAGKDQTIIQGKLANDSITGCSWFAGDSVISTSSTSALVVGKSLSNSFLGAGSRVSAILSATQFQVSVATSTSGNYTKAVTTLTLGSFTVTLPTTTSVAVGHKVEGVGVNATITAWNATTKVMTLSSPVSQSGSNVTLTFRVPRSSQTISQVSMASGSGGPATIMFVGTSNGMVIKDLCAIGFDGVTGQEAAALFFSGNAAPGHQNFLIDNCKLVADGDSAIMCGTNPYLVNGTIQNCLFEGKTFSGSEPADIPAFGFYYTNATVVSAGASSVLQISMVPGIVSGLNVQSQQTPALWTGGSITAVSGNNITINKNVNVPVGTVIPISMSNFAYIVPNVARNLVYLGQNVVGCQTQNITIKNNTFNVQTGAVISATGNKNMFNSVVTLECINGVMEGNVILGSSVIGTGSGGIANYLFRNRQTGAVIQYNVDYTNGQSLLGNYAPSASVVKDNIKPSGMMVSQSQLADSAPEVQMSAGDVNILQSILSHPTFKDQSSWNMVVFVYKHESSSKRLIGAFKDFSVGKKVKMSKRSGVAAGQKYELMKVIVSDSSRNLAVVKRADIAGASSYDFTLGYDWNV